MSRILKSRIYDIFNVNGIRGGIYQNFFREDRGIYAPVWQERNWIKCERSFAGWYLFDVAKELEHERCFIRMTLFRAREIGMTCQTVLQSAFHEMSAQITWIKMHSQLQCLTVEPCRRVRGWPLQIFEIFDFKSPSRQLIKMSVHHKSVKH